MLRWKKNANAFCASSNPRSYAADVQIDPAEIAPLKSLSCNVEANHQGGYEPATVCQRCYVRLQERIDLLEAALHMDLTEATRVVYEAVWADPSDPGKTYQNAAAPFWLNCASAPASRLCLGAASTT